MKKEQETEITKGQKEIEFQSKITLDPQQAQGHKVD